MPRRYPTQYSKAANGGWTDWIVPRKGYRVACCDCHLVHNIEFKVVEKSRAKAKPGYVALGAQVKGVRVLFRVQRNGRATGQLRRRGKQRTGEV